MSARPDTRVEITLEAARSIIDQAQYFSDESGDALASRWVEAVEAAVRRLAAFPELGARTQFRAETLHDVRRVIISGFPNHLVFYRYTKAQHIVLIIDVVHGARDLETLLGSI